jgi:anti-sigma B factor antagonist
LEVEDRDHSLVTTTVSGEFMPLAITSRIVSGVVIMDLSGRLCFLEVGLQNHISARLEAGHREFVVNLADVPYIDSFGLGQLLAILTSIRSRNGELVLLRLTAQARKLFQITKLDTIFHTAEDETHALSTARFSVRASA